MHPIFCPIYTVKFTYTTLLDELDIAENINNKEATSSLIVSNVLEDMRKDKKIPRTKHDDTEMSTFSYIIWFTVLTVDANIVWILWTNLMFLDPELDTSL